MYFKRSAQFAAIIRGMVGIMLFERLIHDQAAMISKYCNPIITAIA